MDNYREKLKISNRIASVCAFALALFSILFVLAEAELIPFPVPVAGDSHWQSRWRGFCSGASFGIMALMIWGIYRNAKALKNEAELKKLYIKEHDERSIQIWTAARAAGMQAFLLTGLAAVVISGYFSITVSITVLLSILLCSMLCLLFKVYYSKKF